MRIEQFTFTRFIGALIVVLGHYGQPFVLHYFDIKMSYTLVGIVPYFHLLSGYIIMIAYGQYKKDNPLDAKRFYINRFARTYPLYFISLIATLLFLYKMEALINYYSIPLNFLLVQAWVPGYVMTLNVVAWSISVELVFYIVFPYLANVYLKKQNILQIGVLCLLLWSISQYFTNYFIINSQSVTTLNINKEFIFYNPVFHLHEFLFGVLGAIIYLEYKDKLRANEYIFLPLLILVILLFKYPIYGTYHNGLLCIVFLPFILLFSFCAGPFTTFLHKKIFTILGECSYAIYILQIPVYMLCSGILIKMGVIREIHIFPIYFAILLVTSFIAYFLVETPFRNYFKKLLKG